MFKRYMLGLFVLSFAMIAIDVERVFADDPPMLFKETDSSVPVAPDEQPVEALPEHIIEIRYATLQLDVLEGGDVPAITINLFDDQTAVFNRIRTDIFPDISGYVWVGESAEIEGVVVYLSVVNGVLYGTVQYNGTERFTVDHISNDLSMIREVDPSKLTYPPMDFGGNVVDIEELNSVDSSSAVRNASTAKNLDQMMIDPNVYGCSGGQEGGQVIDLMLAYTVGACEGRNDTINGVRECTADSEANIEAWITTQVSQMNTANDNSLVNFDWNLAHIEPNVVYATNGDIKIDLDALDNQTDGQMDNLHTVRNANQADIVGLYVEYGVTACGIANTLTFPSNSFEAFAFGVSAVSCGGYTMPHEIGHVMGNNHDPINKSTDFSAVFPYSYGYQSMSGSFRTIMAYARDCPPGGSCQRINHWSNPDVNYAGEPTGLIAGSLTTSTTIPVVVTQTNNTLSMNNIAFTAANWRNQCTIPPLAINETEMAAPVGSNSEFVELKNITAAALNLDTYYLELVENTGGAEAVYTTIDLPNVAIAPNDYFVVCRDQAAVPHCDFETASATNWGTPAAIGLRDSAISDELIDSVAFGGNPIIQYGETLGAPNDVTTPSLSLSRFPDGIDVRDNSTDFSLRCSTPGLENIGESAECVTDLTFTESVTANATVMEGDSIAYTFFVTNTGMSPANASLTQLFSALDAPTCSGELTTYSYDTTAAPIVLGEYRIDTSSCTNALGDNTQFFDGTTDGTNSSPVECAIDVPFNGLISTYRLLGAWSPAAGLHSVGITHPLGTAFQHGPNTFFGSPSSPDTRFGRVQARSELSGFQTNGEWKLRIYENPVAADNGYTIQNNSNIELSGYPSISNTTQLTTITPDDVYTLSSNGTLQIDCTTAVQQNACTTPTTEITKTATLISPQNPNSLPSTAITPIPLVCEGDLSVTKSDSADPLFPGSPLSYTLTVENGGTSSAVRSITLIDTLPAGVTFSSVTPTSACQASGSTVTCSQPLLEQGDSFIATVNVTVDNTTSGIITNSATVTTTDRDPTPANNATAETTTILTADLTITKTSPLSVVEPNKPVTYTIIIANDGGITATATLTDNYSTAALSNYQCDAPFTQIIPPNDTVQYECTAIVEENACLLDALRNTATVTAPEDATPPDPSDVEQFIACNQSIEITKTADISPATVGQTVTYNYTIRNTGNVNVTGLTASDNKLGAVTLGATSLAPDQTTTGTLTYVVQETDSNPITNRVDTSGNTVIGTATAFDNESVAIVVPQVSLNSPTYAVQEDDSVVVVTVTLNLVNSFTDTVVTLISTDDTADPTDYTPITSTVTIPAGQLATTVAIPVTDDNVVENDETFAVTLSIPQQAELGAITDATVTILNEDAAAVSIANTAAPENDGTFPFTITLSAPAAQTVTVSFDTSDSTAAAADYTATSTVVTFPPGTTSQIVSVPVTNELLVENDETMTAVLSDPQFDGTADPTRATLGTSTATGTILNDDSAAISIEDATVLEGTGGTTTAVFTLTLSAPVADDVTVQFSTNDGSAASADYTLLNQTITFPANTQTATQAVTVTSDNLFEADETFGVTLATAAFSGTVDPTRIVISDDTAVGTIIDDDPVTVTIDDVTVNEGAGIAPFTIALSNPSAFSTTVIAQTTSGSATTADYTLTSQTVIIPAGTLTTTLPVPITDDLLNEPSETFSVTLTTPTNGGIGDDAAVGTIIDNDAPPVLSIVSDEIGAESDGVLTFTVQISAVTDANVQFVYGTGNGTTTSNDFTPTSGVGTIPAGQLTTQITVPITADTRDENSETFQLTLSNPTNAILGDDTAIGTITDSNEPPILTITPSSDVESAGTLPITFTLSAASDFTIVVPYTVTGGIVGTGSVTFNSNISTTLNLPLTDNNLDEPDRPYTLTLGTITNATASTTTATGTIFDDDDPIIPLITLNDGAANEGAGTIDFPLSLNVATTQPISVTVTTMNGTATNSALSGADYTLTTETIVIPAGETAALFTVPLIEDETDEPNETFTATLSAPSNVTIAQGTAIGTILDNDDPPPVLSINDVTVNEEAGTADFALTLNTATNRPVTVTIATGDDTAVAGTDYTARNEIVVIPAGDTTLTFAVPIIDDSVDENDETFKVTLMDVTNGTLGMAIGVGTILDNDDPIIILPELSVNGVTVGEADGTADFTLSLDTATIVPITVTITTNDGTATAADYTPLNTTVTIPAGETMLTVPVSITDDTADESDETFTITLSDISNATAGSTTAIGTILDDDDPLILSELSINDVTVSESSGVASFMLSLNIPAALPITVTFQTSDGTADTADYTPISQTITIPAGQTAFNIDIPITDDGDDEPDETFTVTLLSAVNGTIAAGSATGTILDDDLPTETPTIVPSITPQTITPPTFTPTPSPTTVPVTIPVSSTTTFTPTPSPTTISATIPATATATFTPTPSPTTLSVTIPVSATSTSTITPSPTMIRVTVPISATATHTLTPSPTTVAVTIPVSSTSTSTPTPSPAPIPNTVTPTSISPTAVVPTDLPTAVPSASISPSPTPSPSPTSVPATPQPATLSVVSLTNVTVNEGSRIANFILALDVPSDRPITITVTTINGTATNSDYTPLEGTILIPAGDTSATFIVPIIDDDIDEPDETFTVVMQTVVDAAVGNAIGIGTILDNDMGNTVPLPTLRVNDVTVNEGASAAQLLFALNAPASDPITFTIRTEPNTADNNDYTPVTQTILIPAGDTSATVSVPITDDTADEPDETFTVRLSAPFNVTVEEETAVVTIIDNDSTPILPELSIADVIVNEGSGTADVVISLNAPTQQSIALFVTTQDGTATGQDDYVSLSGITITIPAGSTSAILKLPIVDDTAAEADETVQLTLSATDNVTVINNTALITILDNDVASLPRLSINNLTVNEGAGTADFTLSLDTPYPEPITVRLATADETAIGDDDFRAVSVTLTIPADTTFATLKLPIIDDDIVEGEETFTITLFEPTNATIGTGTAIGTILDNDNPPPTLNFAELDAVVSETENRAIFTLSLDRPADEPFTVNVATSDNTAIAGEDYVAVQRTVTIPTGSQSVTVTVPIIDDDLIEPTETFTFTVSTSSGETRTRRRAILGTAVGTIIDNDDNQSQTQNSLALTIDASRDSVEIGETVIYTYTIRNTGDERLNNLILTDDPGGTFTLPTAIAPGATIQFIADYTLTADDYPSVLNTIILSGTAASSTTPITATKTVETGILISLGIPTAAIRITAVSSPTTAIVGQVITTTYTIQNMGDLRLSNVTATDDRYGILPFDTTTLSAGEIATIILTTTVQPDDLTTPFTSGVVVNSVTNDGTSITDTASRHITLIPTTTDLTAALTLSTTVSKDVYGTTLTWESIVTNGSDRAIPIIINDTFPMAIQNPTCSSTTAELTSSLSDTLSLELAIPANSTTTLTCRGGIALGLDASITPLNPIVPIDGEATFTVMITNTGSITLTDITAIDAPRRTNCDRAQLTLAPAETVAYTCTDTIQAVDPVMQLVVIGQAVPLPNTTTLLTPDTQTPLQSVQTETTFNVLVQDVVSTYLDLLVDRGDAPSAFDDASHALGRQLWIGTSDDAPTADSTAQPAFDADSDSDSGITFSTLSLDQPITVTVPIFNETGAAATLVGYLDLNGDMVWSADERISATVTEQGESTMTLHFDSPETLTLYGRFRLTSSADVESAGLAVDGEVEDYYLAKPTQVTHLTSTASRHIMFTISLILIFVGVGGIAAVSIRDRAYAKQSKSGD